MQSDGRLRHFTGRDRSDTFRTRTVADIGICAISGAAFRSGFESIVVFLNRPGRGAGINSKALGAGAGGGGLVSEADRSTAQVKLGDFLVAFAVGFVVLFPFAPVHFAPLKAIF